MQTHRQIIRRKTILWQVAAVGIVLAAGAVAGVPAIGNLFVPSATKIASNAPAAATIEPPKSSLNMSEVTETFKRFSPPAAAPPAPTTPVVVDRTPVNETPPPPAQSDWTYVGSIITPKARHALVRIDGQQQLLGVGAVQDQTKLVAIEKDYIDIEVSGETKRVDLTQRTMLSPAEPPKHPVSFRSLPTFGQPGAPGAPMAMTPQGMNQPGMNMSGMNIGQPSPATFEQARMASQAARDAARQRNPQPVPTPPPPAPAPAEKNTDEKNAALKYLSEPSLDDASRLKFANTLGIVPGMSGQDMVNRLTSSGLDPTTAKTISNIIEQSAKKESDK